jgi:hypothetical protein
MPPRTKPTSDLQVYSQYFFFHGETVLLGRGLLIIEALRSHSHTLHSVVLLWTGDRPSHRLPPDNTKHSQETDIHAPGGILTHNSSKQSVADQCLRQRGHWDRPSFTEAKLRGTVTVSQHSYFAFDRLRVFPQRLTFLSSFMEIVNWFKG